MRLPGPGSKHASMVWLEPRRVHAGGQFHPFPAPRPRTSWPGSWQGLPPGPTRWVVDDAWVPTLLLRDIVELPAGAEAREAFFKLALHPGPAPGRAPVRPGPRPGRERLAPGGHAPGPPGELGPGRRRRGPAHAPPRAPLALALQPAGAHPGGARACCCPCAPPGDGAYTGTLAAWGREPPPAAPVDRARPPPRPGTRSGCCPPSPTSSGTPARPRNSWCGAPPHWPDCGMPVRILQPGDPGPGGALMAVPVLKLDLAPPSTFWRLHHALLGWAGPGPGGAGPGRLPGLHAAGPTGRPPRPASWPATWPPRPAPPPTARPRVLDGTAQRGRGPGTAPVAPGRAHLHRAQPALVPAHGGTGAQPGAGRAAQVRPAQPGLGP